MFPMYPTFGMMWPNILKLRNDYPEPPTIYSILNSYVNFSKETPEKIKNLAKTGRAVIFDFDYPLTSNIDKESFECMILNRFMMRRIGYETVTAFKLQLEVKLNAIMPMYNKLFDSINGWDLFNDGERVTRTNSSTDVNNTTGSATSSDSSNSDQRYSDTPQNALSDVSSGEYVTDYRKNTDSSSSQSSTTGSSTTNSNGTETIIRTPYDKMSIYKEFIENRKSIYTLIFEELDSLFYGLV